MLAAVHVSRAQAVKLLRGVNDGLWFKRSGGAVQIDARIGKSRKLGTKMGRIECVHGVPHSQATIVAQFAN